MQAASHKARLALVMEFADATTVVPVILTPADIVSAFCMPLLQLCTECACLEPNDAQNYLHSLLPDDLQMPRSDPVDVPENDAGCAAEFSSACMCAAL